MKRRIISMLLVLCMICSMLPFTALAAEQTESSPMSEGLSWTIDSEGTLTITGSGPMEEAPWREFHQEDIRNVVIADGITSIADGAFKYCANLENISIPDSVTEIGASAFYECSSLTGVKLPKDLKVLETYTFGWSGLKSLTLPEGLTEIGEYVFYGCQSLSTIDFPDSLTTIGSHAFTYADLEYVNFPDNLVTIADYSFWCCWDLRYVWIPASVQEIGDGAFMSTRLRNIVFKGNAPSIGENAFQDADCTVFYPDGDETWTEEVRTNYGADSITWTDLTVASVTVKDMCIMEGTHGYADDGFFEYYYNPEFSVTFTDGTVYQDDGSGFYIDDIYIPLYFIDDQSADTPWGLGDHEITVLVGQAETTFTITITESPIAGIEVAPMVLTEGLDGELSGYYDENDDWIEDAWFRYEVEPKYVTIHYKDGTSETDRPYEFENRYGEWFSFGSDQSYENQWGIGTHTAYVSFMNLRNEFQVTIQESPVERIETEPMTLIENVNGNWTQYDKDDNWLEEEWFCYSVYPETYTVYYKDGTSLSGRRHEIEEQTGYDIEIITDQNYDNPWGVGTHTGTLKFMGVTCEFQVNVVENPVERIEITPVTLREYQDGYWEGDYDYELGQWNPCEMYYYDCAPETITVYYKDGTVLSGSVGEIEEQTGYSVNWGTEQSWGDPWQAGTHTATATFMNISCEYQVIITESPVDHIEVAPVVKMAYTSGEWYGYWDDVTDEYVENAWFHYDIPAEQITIYYKDGTTLTGTPEEIKAQTGQTVYCMNSAQSYENQWGIGTYANIVMYMGQRCEYQVTITENTLERMEITPITLVEGADGHWTYDWDENDNEVRWYEYEASPKQITLYYQDGTALTASPAELTTQFDTYLSIHTEQSYGNQWQLGGTYTATATFMNLTCDYQVTIIENPVERIEVEPITLRLGIDGYMDGWWNYADEWVPDCWFRHDTCPDTVTIYYKDGTTLTGTPEEIEEKTGYEVTWYDDQDFEGGQWQKPGTYSATAKYLGRTCDYAVYLVDAPAKDYTVTYTSASISLAGDIGVNYYAALSDDVIADEGAYMQFTVAGQTQIVPLSDAVVSTDANGVTTYRFSCKVAAKQMTEDITGQIYLADGTAVGDPKVYSVKAYCDAAIPVYGQYAAYADLVELMEAMLNYGGYSQVQLGYNTDNLANANMDTALPTITEADVDAYAHGATGSEDGISVASVSLLLESTTTIRFYFELDGSKSIDEYTFYVDGVETEPIAAENGQYYVDKVSVAAKDLDEMVTVTVGGLTAQYCGLSYVRLVAVLYAAHYPANLVNVAKALYAYNQAANAYFA